MSARSYAHRLVLERWHTAAEWRAEARIVGGESGWDSCAVYPSMHDCSYRGASSCGIPQRDPCPSVWRGRLYATRYAQARWLQTYIASRYGDPLAALAFHERMGWF